MILITAIIMMSRRSNAVFTLVQCYYLTQHSTISTRTKCCVSAGYICMTRDQIKTT